MARNQISGGWAAAGQAWRAWPRAARRPAQGAIVRDPSRGPLCAGLGSCRPIKDPPGYVDTPGRRSRASRSALPEWGAERPWAAQRGRLKNTRAAAGAGAGAGTLSLSIVAARPAGARFARLSAAMGMRPESLSPFPPPKNAPHGDEKEGEGKARAG